MVFEAVIATEKLAKHSWGGQVIQYVVLEKRTFT